MTKTISTTKQLALYATALIIGCGTPTYVIDKIHQEAVIHEGYLRHVDSLSKEKLVEILEADAEAWAALDAVVNPSDIAAVVSD